ncbi:hypothetical protein [Vibrio variabilis]|uniref:hypothetical protein n=1 Tax=Vibrio variabilis TaxID=990271 RepID=UPI001EFA11B9|nr:hypothetical protein [Vibrio variabilis]
MYPTKYWQTLPDGRVRCTLCPRYCTLREGKRGACFVRQAHQGEIVLTTYGRSSGFCIDPIEKKPLNHFYPAVQYSLLVPLDAIWDANSAKIGTSVNLAKWSH